MPTTDLNGEGGSGRLFLSAMLALALVLASCGSSSGDGESSAVPSGDVSRTIDDEDASNGGSDSDAGPSTASTSEVDLGDFPVSAPPGAESVISAGRGRIQSLVYPVDQYDSIVAFYEEWVDVNLVKDPPPVLATDQADREFSATGTIAEVGIVMITLGETDGELRLGLTLIPTG